MDSDIELVEVPAIKAEGKEQPIAVYEVLGYLQTSSEL
jgi:hypothetical protein